MNQINLTKTILTTVILDSYAKRQQDFASLNSTQIELNVYNELKKVVLNPKECVLYDSVSRFIVTELPYVFEGHLQFSNKTLLNSYIKGLVDSYSNKELLNFIVNDTKEYNMAKVMFLYTPLKLDYGQIKNIRISMGNSRLVMFMYKPKLLGGAQMLIGSNLVDSSWASKVSLLDNYVK